MIGLVYIQQELFLKGLLINYNLIAQKSILNFNYIIYFMVCLLRGIEGPALILLPAKYLLIQSTVKLIIR